MNTYELTWDQWGTPTIAGDTWQAVYEGFGFAQAFNHPNLLLAALVRGQGRAAELLGQHSGAGPNMLTKQPTGVDYLQSDRLVWQLDIAALGELYWQQQDPLMVSHINAFCRGINACRQAHPERFDKRFSSYEQITGPLIMAHIAHILVGFQVMIRQPTLVQWMQGEQAVTPSWADFAGAGSNACVIGAKKSLHGHPMLVCNPHTQWDADLNTFTESHLQLRNQVSLVGASMVGWPGHMMGCNGHGGYAGTVNTQSSLSFYQILVEAGQVSVDKQPHAVAQATRQIKCRQEDGSFVEHSQLQTWSECHQAFSLAQRHDEHLLMAYAGREQGQIVRQMFDMSVATCMEEFKQALQQHQLPLFNLLYAGRDKSTAQGHIHYSFHSLPAQRDKGTWADWWQVLDGHNSANICTGITAFGDMFQDQDAVSGWYQNCNDSPHTCTLPSPFDPADYPAWLSPVYTNFRAQGYSRLLTETEQFDFDSFVATKFNTRSEMALRVVPELIRMIDALAPDECSLALTKARQVLVDWDYLYEPDSRGACLFLYWLLQQDLADAVATPLFADAWQWQQAAHEDDCLQSLNMPSQLACAKASLVALEQAASLLTEQFGGLDIAWGEVIKLTHGKHTIAAVGGPGDPLGIVAAVPLEPSLRPFIKAGTLPANRIENDGGETFVMAVEFTAEGAQGGTFVSYGNSSYIDGDHFGDQLQLLSQRKLKPFNITI